MKNKKPLDRKQLQKITRNADPAFRPRIKIAFSRNWHDSRKLNRLEKVWK